MKKERIGLTKDRMEKGLDGEMIGWRKDRMEKG